MFSIQLTKVYLDSTNFTLYSFTFHKILETMNLVNVLQNQFLLTNSHRKSTTPKYSGQKFSNFFIHILGNTMASYFHSEIS